MPAAGERGSREWQDSLGWGRKPGRGDTERENAAGEVTDVEVSLDGGATWTRGPTFAFGGSALWEKRRNEEREVQGRRGAQQN